MVMRRRMLEIANNGGSPALPLLYDWDLKTSLTDIVQRQVCQLSGATRDNDGLHITGQYNKAYFGEVFPVNRTLEVTVDSMAKSSSMTSSANGRFIMLSGSSSMSMSSGTSNGFIWRGSGSKWGIYHGAWSMSSNNVSNLFNGKKLIMKYYKSGAVYATDIYANEDLIQHYVTANPWNANHPFLEIGTYGSAYYNITISRVKIFEGV